MRETKGIYKSAGVALTMALAVLVGFTEEAAAQRVRVEESITTIDIEVNEGAVQYPIQLSEQQWRARLSDFEYKVLRREGTERAYSDPLFAEKRSGIYYSRATGQPLFSSDHKYDSRTGWPSFWRPIRLDVVDYHVDRGLFGTRIEVVDSSSGSHLGHVFRDGPRPTGWRYCINGAALIFVPDGESPPAIVRQYLAQYEQEE